MRAREYTDRWTDRQIDRWMGRWTDKGFTLQIVKKRDGQGVQTDGWTGRWMGGLADRQRPHPAGSEQA